MEFKIKPYNLIIIILTFIVFTIIGTISHEYGHIAVAEYLGYNTTLHYGSMSWTNKSKERLFELGRENQEKLNNNENFPEKDEFEKLYSKYKEDRLLIAIGGPSQTILTALCGIIILFFRRIKIRSNGLMLFDWTAIFLSLFWLRQVFNPILSIVKSTVKGYPIYFMGDEEKITQLLALPNWSIAGGLGILGLAFSLFVGFKFIPKELRSTFVIGGFIGAMIGYPLWFYLMGPILIP